VAPTTSAAAAAAAAAAVKVVAYTKNMMHMWILTRLTSTVLQQVDLLLG
jgi:hypothetical protein